MAALATTESEDAQREGGDDFRFSGHHGNQNRREKVSQGKKTQFLRTAENLRRQVDKLEKEKVLSNQSRNLFRDDSGTVEEFETKLMHDHRTEVMKLQQQLKKVHNGVKRFQRQLMDVKPTPELIEKLKEIMTEVENSITTFKEDKRQSFEDLLKKEYTCWQEVCALEKKIGVWALAGPAGSKVPPAHPAKVCLTKAPDGASPPEVNELERFLLLTGGRQGGWDQYDHEVFLKERAKKSGKQGSGRDAHPHVPGKRREEVEQHEEWYQRLLFLEEKKREAILKWKTQKQNRREQELRQQKEKEDAAKREEAELAGEQQRQLEEERREAAARLDAWKDERRVQVAMEQEKQVKEEVLHRKRAKEERRRQLEVKLTMEAHVRARKQQQELLLLEKEYQEQEDMEERQRTASIGIKIFQERDIYRLEAKLQEKQYKEEEEAERQKRMAKMKEKVESHISRDPSRLCKPTKGWQERTKVIGPTGGGPVSQMFHRAVPSWRQDL